MGQFDHILEAYKSGHLDLDQASAKLEQDLCSDIGHSVIDHDRTRRQGYPEVIYAEGKKPDQVADIFANMIERGSNVLATRATDNTYFTVQSKVPDAVYHEDAGIISLTQYPAKQRESTIAVVSAGTSDQRVAEEAAVTAEFYGNPVKRIRDVGVAGIHRLFRRLDEIRSARVVIVVAGMEGALPSAVGGLIDKPIIAVPTSVGYGANFGGLSALLGMLNSCASGVTVVNIDNGFGAGYSASMINGL